MFNRKTMISITAIGLLAIGISAQADFKSTSTGTGVAASFAASSSCAAWEGFDHR